MTGRSVLITGAGGFLARFTAEAFREAGWRVHGISRRDTLGNTPRFDSFVIGDLSSSAATARTLLVSSASLVVHLAGPASVARSLADPLGDLQSQLLPLASLLEAIRASGLGSRLLLVSSAAVYGQPVTLPIPETASLSPISPYGFHKRLQESLCEEATTIFGIETCSARIFSTFGEGLRQLAVWDITRRALAGDFTVHGTGDETRDFLYAGDAGRALAAIAAQAPFAGEQVNVAGGRGTTIRELSHAIHRLAGTGASPRFDGTIVSGNPARWIASIDRLRSYGFEPAASLDAGLQPTIDWIRAQP